MNSFILKPRTRGISISTPPVYTDWLKWGSARLTAALYHPENKHYKRYCKVPVSLRGEFRAISLDQAREVVSLLTAEYGSFYFFRGFLKTPLGSIIHHVELNHRGRPILGLQDVPNSTPETVRPEFMAEWHALRRNWRRYVELLEEYPSVAQHILSDVFVDAQLPELIEARELARYAAAKHECNSAIDEIAAELGVL